MTTSRRTQENPDQQKLASQFASPEGSSSAARRFMKKTQEK